MWTGTETGAGLLWERQGRNAGSVGTASALVPTEADDEPHEELAERARAPERAKGGGGHQPWTPSRGAACAHPCLPSLCQINNYLTVPAHKLDSPTMSRARIGSGKAGHRVPGKGPGGWALRTTVS